MGKIVSAKCPTRISLGGGGSDVPPFPGQDPGGGACLNFTINRPVYVEVHQNGDMMSEWHDLDTGEVQTLDGQFRGDGGILYHLLKDRSIHTKRGFKIYTKSDVPRQSGLGASSAFTVAALAAVNRIEDGVLPPVNDLIDKSFDIERNKFNAPGGWQDFYTAVGGMQFIEFNGGYNVSNQLKIGKDNLSRLEKSLCLYHVGERQVDEPVADQMRRIEEGGDDGQNMDALRTVRDTAYDMKDALLRGDMDELGELLDRNWEHKKRFHPDVSNDRVDAIYDAALGAGAVGGKLTGAGSGGHMILVVPDLKTRHRVSKELGRYDVVEQPWAFVPYGVRVWES